MGRARAQDDNWFGIQDPRKRKQIQDRLAQRARRKRLAEAKQSVEVLDLQVQSYKSSSSESPDSVGSESTALTVSHYPVSNVPQSPSGYPTIVNTSKGTTTITCTISSSIYGALYHNGAMMGISCSISSTSTSSQVGPEIPDSLQPTELQLTIAHPRWIDRFPFPKMRDNMITLMGIIDEEEFLADLFCFTSFILDPGAAPWDPKAWKIGKEFSAKWGYLFY